LKKISIASYAFHGMLQEGKMDVFGYLESCKYRYHLESADIWNGMLVSTEEDYLKKIKEALDEKELTLANLCVDRAQLWAPEPEAREQLYKNALLHLRAAEILGAKTVRIDMGVKESALTEEQLEYIVSRYQEYAQIAYNAGFKVGPENHYGAALIPDHILKVSEAVNHQAYGILLHFGHWDADKDHGDQRAAKWTMHTHIDMKSTAERIEQCLQLLVDADYTGYWGIEHHSGSNEYAEVEWQLATVKRALKALQNGSGITSFQNSENPLLD
jgi:sugar phosphate isomerase/epimerase